MQLEMNMDRPRINIEVKVIFIFVAAIFGVFLLYPMMMVLSHSFMGKTGFSIEHYVEVLTNKKMMRAFGNSLWISTVSGTLTTCLAFILAYTVNYTNVKDKVKNIIRSLAFLPMLLPTITYGFAIMYSFGKNGLLTKLVGTQFISAYGHVGLIMGYVIYTLPISFMLINNTMGYMDKRFLIVSKIMGDSDLKSFLINIGSPLLGTLAASFIQCFFLSFTDFGIPESVGGEVKVIASVLYGEMLGSIPNFGTGSVVALMMLLPSIVSIGLIKYLERYNVEYKKISQIEIPDNRKRDWTMVTLSALILISILSVFAVIFVAPFTQEWPYETGFTVKHVMEVLMTDQLIGVYKNSLIVAGLTALLGSLIVYGAAIITTRVKLTSLMQGTIDSISVVTNTIPGMVLGIGFLMAFSGSPMQNTMVIIIVCNIIHYFSTPYLMMKNTLSKMNSGWETTAKLMGDSWTKTVARIITPNAISTLCETFSYFFVNGMVTISAVIFIAGARTMMVTTKIKELQHFSEFNKIFVLSLLILLTNLIVKLIIKLVITKFKK